MGHIVNPDREYRLLQRRLDQKVTGAPDSPTLTKILKLLFTPEEAEVGSMRRAVMPRVRRLLFCLQVWRRDNEAPIQASVHPRNCL